MTLFFLILDKTNILFNILNTCFFLKTSVHFFFQPPIFKQVACVCFIIPKGPDGKTSGAVYSGLSDLSHHPPRREFGIDCWAWS